MNEEKTIGELLQKYPEGFFVGPSGMISKTLLATSHFVAVARQYPVAPSNGGYLVVEMTDEGESDELKEIAPIQDRVNDQAKRFLGLNSNGLSK